MGSPATHCWNWAAATYFEPILGGNSLFTTFLVHSLKPCILFLGRLDACLEVGLPTLEDRLEILKLLARRTPIAADVNIGAVAEALVGASGAQVAHIWREAALHCLHQVSISFAFILMSSYPCYTFSLPTLLWAHEC